jgi:hypothetical protein
VFVEPTIRQVCIATMLLDERMNNWSSILDRDKRFVCTTSTPTLGTIGLPLQCLRKAVALVKKQLDYSALFSTKVKNEWRYTSTTFKASYYYSACQCLKNAGFWDVTPCSSCKNRRFRGTHLLFRGDMFLQNVCSYKSHTATHPRRRHS